MISRARNTEPFVSTQNPCTLCTPFGATLALAGIDRAMPLLHGSQGCSTYIRRYLIGHFREPMDVACSNFSEQAAVFGGRDNLMTALANVCQTYRPNLIGVATTCLAETIGDDVKSILREFTAANEDAPPLVPISTPSYRGTHAEGFHAATRAVIETLADDDPWPDCPKQQHVNLLPGMVSPADLRHLRELADSVGLELTILPDYADRLDGPAWEEYHRIPEGGTTVEELRRMGRADASLEFTSTLSAEASPAALAERTFGVRRLAMPLPVGVKACDTFFDTLRDLSGRELPALYADERGRLLDAYVDGHKYLFEKRAVVYGEEDLVAALAGMLCEVGIFPALCASGGRSGNLRTALEAACGERAEDIEILDDADFVDIERRAEEIQPDLLIGNSNGAKIARKLSVPLVRVGMPIHDRMGAARVLTVGYRGTMQLFDRLCNAIIAQTQDASPYGYTHM
jgi:nitrogenase molybdenum-iron protein NifN